MDFLEKTFAEVRSLKSKTPASSFDKDYDHAVEEFFEIIKARRALRDILLADPADEEAIVKAQKHLREEVIDLAICCIGMFLALGGDLPEFSLITYKKLQKWGRSLRGTKRNMSTDEDVNKSNS